jgi:predicted porin
VFRHAVIAVSALVLALPAAASEVQIYGRMNLSLDYLDDGDNGAVNLSNNSSRLGFRGAHPLAPGLEGVFQIESGINTDISGGTLAARDTFAGIRGSLGLLRGGFFNTPLKALRSNVDLFGDQLGDARNITRNRPAPYAVSPASPGQGFDERFRNGIHYQSPLLGNWQLDLHYSTNTNNSGYTGDNDRDALSSSLSYRFGGLYLAAARENYSGSRKASRFAGAYDAGVWRFTTLYQEASDPDDKAWGVGLRYRPASTAYRIQYYRLDADAPESDAAMLAVGFEHELSKAFSVYLNYARMRNDDNQNLTPFDAARSARITAADDVPALGATTSGYSLGIVYRF